MKQNTRNRLRRFTAAQKKLISQRGVDPEQYRLCAENERFLFIINPNDPEDRLSIPK